LASRHASSAAAVGVSWQTDDHSIKPAQSAAISPTGIAAIPPPTEEYVIAKAIAANKI